MASLTTSPGCATTTHPMLSASTSCDLRLMNARLTAILSERISTVDKVDVFFTGTGGYQKFLMGFNLLRTGHILSRVVPSLGQRPSRECACVCLSITRRSMCACSVVNM